MSLFDDLARQTDLESVSFTYDVRKLLQIADTRAQVRRIQGLIGSALQDLHALNERCDTTLQTLKD